MKQLLIITLITCLGLEGFSQSRALENFIDDYRGKRDVTHLSLSGSVFQFASWLAELNDGHDEELEAIGKISDGIESMEILSIDNYSDFFENSEIEKLIEDMEDEGYEILMTVREEDQLMRILSKTGKGKMLNDVTMINRDRHDFSIISMKGSIRMEDLDRIID